MSTTTITDNCTLAPTENAHRTASEISGDVGAAGGAAPPTQCQDLAATDSGRESVNEFDSSLDEAAHLCKKPCTAEFYASSGSQTKWYCEPAEVDAVASDDDPVVTPVEAISTTTSLSSEQVAQPKDEVEAAVVRSERLAFPRTRTTNDGISVIGIRNGFTTNLSQQIRAVSSPSLTDAMQESENATTNSSAMTQLERTADACDESSRNHNKTNTTIMTTTTSSLTTSQSVGVLQKFKRTLTNFNRSQQPQQSSTTTTISAVCNNNVDGVGTTTAGVQLLAPMNLILTNSDATDASNTAKYRFGPLIWRSSKERRKTKYNRRDKCNSGDSGIQIELENDEQFARVIANGGIAVTGKSPEESPKSRSVRRTNSAKASTIADQTTATLNAKAKIMRKMEIWNEREAPESLPTRSLSQPNGLDTFGIGRADLDESDSDSVASHDEGPNYYPIYAEVLYNFTAAGPQELGLERGTLIEVLRKEVGPWWFGRIKKEDASLVEEILDPELGWFPKEFVRVIQNLETDAFFMAQVCSQQERSTVTTAPSTIITTPPTAPPTATVTVTTDTPPEAEVDQSNVTTIVIESPSSCHTHVVVGDCNALAPARNSNVIIDNACILRHSAIKELLDTEVNYVKLLASICEGYLPAMSKRIDIFSPNSIRLIFSNISAIFKFQRKFLDALRKGIEQNQIAQVFLKMHKGFLCYSTYCNAYPRALIELESYDRVKDAKTILDNCRESENLAELPLSAHLLAPVQRICRYPLHLGEILKTTAKMNTECSTSTNELQEVTQNDASQLNLPDTSETIEKALEAMKSITEAVNEGKRHSETIARHQASFQHFKGPPLHLHSTRFFLQIDATRQKQNLWNSSCTLFLFDNQLIYCKRDIIKRSHFIYKGRIFLDRCRVVNVRDGKMFGHTIKNSLRIYCEVRDKWYDFSFRSANRKLRLLNTLALERQFGGKALYISEMTGFEYAFEERDYSDQSDYEMPESESGGGGSLAAARMREFLYDVGMSATTASGESSLPESPAKSFKYSSETLPKNSHSRENSSASAGSSECQTSSLGRRRRLGNWFRKPKSSHSTPNHSPTHKPATLLVAELPAATDANSTYDASTPEPKEISPKKEITTVA